MYSDRCPDELTQPGIEEQCGWQW